MTNAFDQLTFRTARGLAIVPYNRLEEAHGCRFDSRALHRTGFGVALSKQLDGPVLELDQNMALLLHVLRDAGPLPDHAIDSLDDGLEEELAKLVLSGILEVFENECFHSGSDALALLGLQTSTDENPESVSAILSHSAIKHVCAMQGLVPAQVFSALYRFNTIPASRHLREMVDDACFLKLDEIGSFWQRSETMPGWLYFQKRSAVNEVACEAKLYVSPQPSALPEALHAVARVLQKHERTSFKVGTGVAGRIRPDKLVVYFPSVESLLILAGEIEEQVAHLPAQGVPFTAAFTRDGMLSWGVDPRPEDPQDSQKSWRQWVTETIATLIHELRTQTLPPSNDLYALVIERMSLQGIDINTFKPRASWINEHR